MTIALLRTCSDKVMRLSGQDAICEMVRGKGALNRTPLVLFAYEMISREAFLLARIVCVPQSIEAHLNRQITTPVWERIPN